VQTLPEIYDNTLGGEPRPSDYNDGEDTYDTIDAAPQTDFSEPFTVLSTRDVDDSAGYNEAEA